MDDETDYHTGWSLLVMISDFILHELQLHCFICTQSDKDFFPSKYSS